MVLNNYELNCPALKAIPSICVQNLRCCF